MRWLSRRRERASAAGRDEREGPLEVGGDRIVFWKSKEQDENAVDYGPVWIADANDPNVRLEEPDLWLTWEQAEAFARKRGLPLEDV